MHIKIWLQFSFFFFFVFKENNLSYQVNLVLGTAKHTDQSVFMFFEQNAL